MAAWDAKARTILDPRDPSNVSSDDGPGSSSTPSPGRGWPEGGRGAAISRSPRPGGHGRFASGSSLEAGARAMMPPSERPSLRPGRWRAEGVEARGWGDPQAISGAPDGPVASEPAAERGGAEVHDRPPAVEGIGVAVKAGSRVVRFLIPAAEMASGSHDARTSIVPRRPAAVRTFRRGGRPAEQDDPGQDRCHPRRADLDRHPLPRRPRTRRPPLPRRGARGQAAEPPPSVPYGTSIERPRVSRHRAATSSRS